MFKILAALVVALTFRPGPAVADENAPAWTPAGDNWWCYSAAISNETESIVIGACSRSKHACLDLSDADRRFALADKLYFGKRAFHCARSEKAVLFTVHDIVQDRIEPRAFPTIEQCVDHRRRLLRLVDYDQVSRCAVVGDVEPAAFDTDLVPAGKGWYCVRIGNQKTPGVCSRSKEKCDQKAKGAADLGDTVGACRFRRSAFAMTAGDTLYVFEGNAACEGAAELMAKPSRCMKI